MSDEDIDRMLTALRTTPVPYGRHVREWLAGLQADGVSVEAFEVACRHAIALGLTSRRHFEMLVADYSSTWKLSSPGDFATSTATASARSLPCQHAQCAKRTKASSTACPVSNADRTSAISRNSSARSVGPVNALMAERSRSFSNRWMTFAAVSIWVGSVICTALLGARKSSTGGQR